MRGLVLSLALAAGAVFFAAAPFTADQAQAAPGAGAVPVVAAPAASASVQPVYWVWQGRHWNHRRWAPRVRVRGVWVPGHYTYY